MPIGDFLEEDSFVDETLPSIFSAGGTSGTKVDNAGKINTAGRAALPEMGPVIRYLNGVQKTLYPALRKNSPTMLNTIRPADGRCLRGSIEITNHSSVVWLASVNSVHFKTCASLKSFLNPAVASI